MQNSTTPVTKCTLNSTSKNATTRADYDHLGAMQFIIATVLVYSTIGVCCTLVVRIKRSHTPKSHSTHTQDEHVQKYLKEEKYLKSDGFKMKLTFECERTKERLNEIDGRVRLLDIQKSVTCPDFSEKKHKKKPRKSRLGSLVGKMGFSLFYFPEVDTNDIKPEEVEMKRNGYLANSAASSISGTQSQSLSNVSEV